MSYRPSDHPRHPPALPSADLRRIKPLEAPVQREQPLAAELQQSPRSTRAGEARAHFGASGAGTTVAVLGTGLRTTHLDFAGRVAAQRNFVLRQGGRPNDASDGHGHGTHVAGMICAAGNHVGVAPSARIVPLKVVGNDGRGDFSAVEHALQWVIEHGAEHDISALCLAFGDGANHQSDDCFAQDAIARSIARLAEASILCCVTAGDDYFTHGSAQGMSYPAILRSAISVGSLFDADLGPLAYAGGAEAYETASDRITPVSQRLHDKVGRGAATTIFAPGVPAASTGTLNDIGASIHCGASQAAALVTGIVLLLQSLYKNATGRLPSAFDVRRWLLAGAVDIVDKDDEHDNVLHTGQTFRRVDAFAALDACARDLIMRELAAGDGPLLPRRR